MQDKRLAAKFAFFAGFALFFGLLMQTATTEKVMAIFISYISFGFALFLALISIVMAMPDSPKK